MSYLDLLDQREPPPPVVMQGRPAPRTEKLEGLDVIEFITASLVIRIDSSALGCELLLVSDDVPDIDVPDLGLAVHRASELKKIALWQPYPQDLQRVHLVADVLQIAYGATIREIQKADAEPADELR